MFLIMFAAILGGVATLITVTIAHGALAGLLLAPFGGSTLAVVAAGFNAWRTPAFDVEEATDQMVADLQGAVEAGRRFEPSPAPCVDRGAA